MKLEDFYQLRVGQIIFWDKQGFILNEKLESSMKDHALLFVTLLSTKTGESITLRWDQCCSSCSLEAPKEKKIKRFWQWKVKDSSCRWLRCDSYFDENGIASNGDKLYPLWDQWEKSKIEDDFVDVEVES